jgi:hypothetical protein
MIPVAIASLVAAGVVGLLGVGVMQMFRRREMTIKDHLELPAPRDEDRREPA